VSETESLMLRILEGLQRDMADMKRDMADVKHEMGGLREDMQAGFAATLRQGDRRFLDHEGRLRTLEKRRSR
jgi:hypothetical protein